MFMSWMWACAGRRYCCRELRYSLCISKIDRSISKRVILRRIKTTRARRCHPQDACLSNKPLSQSCCANGWPHNKSFQSLVIVLTQLHFGQWSSLPFCLPTLIVQWPARSFHFSLLRMIVIVTCQ